jgi:predicted  nucleic acid-binding Zn-ribbon protein
MSDKEYYQQKLQAQMDEWKAELERLRAKAAGARAEVKHDLSHQIEGLEKQLEHGKAKFAELLAARDDAWETLKEGVESSWGSLKTAFKDAAQKFKD